MSTAIQRPLFFFGQYLGADDLQTLLDYARGQMGRHERYLHTWGIAGGLALIKISDGESLGIKYKRISVAAGIAIDGYGREIVVAEDEPLDISVFQQQSVFVKDAWHPVYLQAIETVPASAAIGPVSCDVNASKRVNEGFEIVFGRPGTEKDDPPPPVPFDTRVPAADSLAPWKILLGFVKFDSTITQLTDFTTTSDGVGPKYAGVQADEVVARGGSLTLRSKPSSQNDAPALVVSPNSEDSFFLFGKQSNGTVLPLVRISSKGDITAEGTIDSKKTSVKAESGILSHGMPVPLPAGVTEQDVTDGNVILHIHVSAKAPAVPPVPNTITTPLECSVSPQRIVTCLVASFTVAGAATVAAPGLCEYMIVATAP